MSKVTTTIEMMDANKAASIIGSEGQTFNRRISRSWIAQLSTAMVSNQWRMNGESIKIDDKGHLIDGQHRLRALIAASEEGVTQIPMMVTRGLPHDVFDTLDQGKRRNAADVLSIRGEQNCAVLSTGLRHIFYLLKGKSPDGKVTTQDIELMLDEYPSARFWTHEYASSKVKNICPASLVGILTLGALRHGDDKAMSFLQEVANGTNLQSGQPSLLLREKFIESRASPSKRLMAPVQFALMIKAWNAHATGKKIGVLKQASEEAFPLLK